MNEILHANIFFIIASLATVVFVILVSVVLYQVIKILKTVRTIVERVERGSEHIEEDIAHIRSFVLEGSLLSQVVGFFFSRGATKRKTRKKRATKDTE